MSTHPNINHNPRVINKNGDISYQNYCDDVRPMRTQFDKDLQNMWCPSCCPNVNLVSPSGPTGPVGVMAGGRYGNAVEDVNQRGEVKVAGVY